MSEHTFVFKNGESITENCEYCRELETENWHYYKNPDGKMIHLRKDAIAMIVGGTYEDIIQNRESKRGLMKRRDASQLPNKPIKEDRVVTYNDL